MTKFEKIIKYLPLLEDDKIGTWIIDHENDGTSEHPFLMPHVQYSEMAHHFIKDVYDFYEDNSDFELSHYDDVLEKNGLKWDFESMSEADVSALDAQCVMALIMGAIRADRFCDGALLEFFRNGSIRKWLIRLKEIDGSKD